MLSSYEERNGESVYTEAPSIGEVSSRVPTGEEQVTGSASYLEKVGDQGTSFPSPGLSVPSVGIGA